MLNFVLLNCLEAQMRRDRRLTREDVEDLASEKSLDLMRKLDLGTWEIRGKSGREIAAYLAATARNGVVDFFRSPDCRRRKGGPTGDAAIEGLDR